MSMFAAMTLVAGLGLLVVGWRVLRPRPRLRIGERGIRHPALRLGWIRWDEIEGAYPPTLSDGDALRLKLRLSERLKRRLRGKRRDAAGRETASVEVRIDLAGSEIGPLELLQEILSRSGGSPTHHQRPAPSA